MIQQTHCISTTFYQQKTVMKLQLEHSHLMWGGKNSSLKIIWWLSARLETYRKCSHAWALCGKQLTESVFPASWGRASHFYKGLINPAWSFPHNKKKPYLKARACFEGLFFKALLLKMFVYTLVILFKKKKSATPQENKIWHYKTRTIKIFIPWGLAPGDFSLGKALQKDVHFDASHDEKTNKNKQTNKKPPRNQIEPW